MSIQEILQVENFTLFCPIGRVSDGLIEIDNEDAAITVDHEILWTDVTMENTSIVDIFQNANKPRAGNMFV
jgi:hypothetical protein